jgi:hypothetical protein
MMTSSLKLENEMKNVATFSENILMQLFLSFFRATF